MFSCAAVSEGKQVGRKHKLTWGGGGSSPFVRAQEVDDVTRVSEAVAKVVVFALKGASSGDNADDWLNPTEVALEHQSHVRSVTLCFLRHGTNSQCVALCKTFAPTVAFSFSFVLFREWTPQSSEYFFSRHASTVKHCPHLAEVVYYQSCAHQPMIFTGSAQRCPAQRDILMQMLSFSECRFAAEF